MLLSVAEGFVFQGFVVFLPAFLAQLGGLGAGAAAKGGALSAVVLLLGVPGQLASGRLAEAAVFSFLGAVAVLNVLGGLAVRRLLGRPDVSTTTPSRS